MMYQARITSTMSEFHHIPSQSASNNTRTLETADRNGMQPLLVFSYTCAFTAVASQIAVYYNNW